MSSRFLVVKTIDSAEDNPKLHVNEIVRLHGVPLSIISDIGPLFTSNFWKSVQKVLGTQINLSTIFHPQTDGQAERTIQTLDDMLRSCVIDFKGGWDDHLLLILSWPTKIAIIPAFGWPFLSLCIGIDVDLLVVSLKKVKQL